MNTMMIKNWTAAALLALLLAPAVYATDNGTEFGIEDDLTVMGSTGTWADPDVEIKGFTVFGPLAGPQVITSTNGNVAIRGNLQADSTAYFGSSVTVAGYGVLQSTVQFLNNTGNAVNLYFDNAAANTGKVLKATGNGFLEWAADQNTTMTFNTPYRLQMVNSTDDGLADTQFVQDGGGNSLSLMASSMTIKGNGTDGLGVAGAVKLDGNTSVLNANTFTVGAGASTLGGTLNVAGDADLDARLNVDGDATFASSATIKGVTQLGDTAGTDKVAVNMTSDDGRATGALNVAGGAGNGNFVAKFYSGADLAAWIKKK